jgi:hypothetical protein
MNEDEQIQEDELVEDEIVEVEEESEEESEEKPDPYRSKLNATNRFLQKEGYEFKNGSWVKPEQVKTVPKKQSDSSVTALDTLAFIDAGVTNSEDIAEVMRLAKGFSMGISDALKDDTVKHRLNVFKEQRKTAEATNTRTARSGVKQIDSKAILDNLSKGEVPNTGTNEAEELYWARRGGRRK